MEKQEHNTSILVFSAVPPKKMSGSAAYLAAGAYLYNLLRHLAHSAKRNNNPLKIKILTNTADGEKRIKKYKNGITVERVWKKTTRLLFPVWLYRIAVNKDCRSVMINFEFSLFGNRLNILLFPLFLAALKLLRRNTILFMHQLVPGIGRIYTDMGKEEYNVSVYTHRVIMKMYYRLIFPIVDKLVIHEPEFKKEYIKSIHPSKIEVIPYAVERYPSMPGRLSARKKLNFNKNDFVLLTFGTLAWYKGTDWIIDRIKNIDMQLRGKTIKLIIAGGIHPNLITRQNYYDFISRIKRDTHSAKGRIIMTGFVDENKIPLYYVAADLVVIPQRVFLFSSRLFSLALSFRKPFLLSDSLDPLLNSLDIRKNLEKNSLDKNDLVFGMDGSDFRSRLTRIVNNPRRLRKIQHISSEIAKTRDVKAVSELFAKKIIGINSIKQ